MDADEGGGLAVTNLRDNHTCAAHMRALKAYVTLTRAPLKGVCLSDTAAFLGEASPGKDTAPHAKVQEGCADSRDLHFVLIKCPAQHAIQPPQVPPLHSAQKLSRLDYACGCSPENAYDSDLTA